MSHAARQPNPSRPSSPTSPTGPSSPTGTPGAETRVAVALPPRWAVRSDAGRGLVAAARARTPTTSGLAPEVVVLAHAVAHAAGPDGLEAWRSGALADLAAHLDGFEVEDEDAYDVGGRPAAYVRFAHRVGGVEVLCEQWAWLVDGDGDDDGAPALGVTVTGTVAREDWADYCEVFEGVAATVECRSPAA